MLSARPAPIKAGRVPPAVQSPPDISHTMTSSWDALIEDQEKIAFESERHKYTRDNIESDISVTGALSKLFPFDATEVARRCVKSAKYAKCRVQAGGVVNTEKTADNIRKVWAEKAKEGTILHELIEEYIRGDTTDPHPDLVRSMERFFKYIEKHGFTFKGAEVKFFLPKCVIDGETLNLAGSIDALYANERGEALIVDWKKSTPMFDFFGKRGSSVMSNYPNTNFWKYTAQLNMYALALERGYNIKTVGKMLVFFEDVSSVNVRMHHVPDMPEICEFWTE